MEDGNVVINRKRFVDPKNTLLVCRNIEELQKITAGQGGGIKKIHTKKRQHRSYIRRTKRNK